MRINWSPNSLKIIISSKFPDSLNSTTHLTSNLTSNLPESIVSQAAMQPINAVFLAGIALLGQLSFGTSAVLSSQEDSGLIAEPSVVGSADECQCGVRQSDKYNREIVGGSDAKPGEFPWYVNVYAFALLEGNQGGNKKYQTVKCGGTIISPNWVLTEAHCLTHAKNASDIWLLFNTGHGNTTFDIAHEFILHERYGDFTNDVALIHVETPFEFGETGGPACLPWNLTQDLDGANVTTSGLGAINVISAGNETFPNTLQKVTLQIVGARDCNQTYQQSLPADVICAGAPGKGPCIGDSGGALEYFDPSTQRSYVIGVTNFFGVDKCAQDGYPSGYTRVASHLDWIQAKTSENFCKN